jgi:hypothetical protein
VRPHERRSDHTTPGGRPHTHAFVATLVVTLRERRTRFEVHSDPLSSLHAAQAVNGSDGAQWIEAIKDEVQSLIKHGTWRPATLHGTLNFPRATPAWN